jgi:hypothetical protein
MTSETVVDDATAVTVTFDDLYVLDTEDVEVFVLDLNARDEPPPFYIDVDGRRFGFMASTFLLRGHGAALPDYVQAEEAEGRLVLFGERDDRLLVYGHDPSAEDEEEDDDSEGAE